MGHIWSNDKRTYPLEICYDLFSPQREGSTLSAIINNFSSWLLHDFPIRPPHGLHPALPRPPSTHPPPSILLGIIMLIQAIRLYFLSLKKMFMWRPHGVGPSYSIPLLSCSNPSAVLKKIRFPFSFIYIRGVSRWFPESVNNLRYALRRGCVIKTFFIALSFCKYFCFRSFHPSLTWFAVAGLPFIFLSWPCPFSVIAISWNRLPIPWKA